MTTEKLISVKQAVAQGIDRVRKPVWANPLDHLKIDIVNGQIGPWFHVWSPFNKACNGRDPVDILWSLETWVGSVDDEAVVPYTGPLPDSEEYKAEEQRLLDLHGPYKEVDSD